MKQLRGHLLGAALVLALAASGASVARAGSFTPGYSDFPNALRLAQWHEEFNPGYTDFPNALRLAPDTRNAPGQIPPAPIVGRSTAFDWGDAGIGALGGVAIVLLLAAALFLLRRGTAAKLAVLPKGAS